MCPEQADGPGSRAGVYAVVLRVHPPGLDLRVGALGRVGFRAGWYVYVGSALRGLGPRLRRHLRREDKRLHWHIDYLRERAAVSAALYWETTAQRECSLSRAVGRLADGQVPGFGSSDCDCPSHLHFCRFAPLPWLLDVQVEERPGHLWEIPRGK